MKPITRMLAPALLLAIAATARAQDAQDEAPESRAATRPESRASSRPAALELKEARAAMGKWHETLQIISKERREWEQGKDVLLGRIDLVKQEVSTLEERIKQAEASVAEAEKKKQALVAENDQLKATSEKLAGTLARMETEVRALHKRLPEPIQQKIQPLYQRIPEDASKTKISNAERFQNVIGIFNEVNKANNEIIVNYEVHTLADGRRSEVKAIYVGLAQAYYVSEKGEAGIGRPTDEGWKWEPSKSIAGDVLTALEILQNKHSPAFVPLPVKIK
jgi:chromosome segregation ATPase